MTILLEPVLKDSKCQLKLDFHLQPDLDGPESESEVSGEGEFISMATEVDEILPTC